jgi:Co/Zn/Cd efflux system component
MDDCCNKNESEIVALKSGHAKVLWIVLLINASMFLVEYIFGWLSHSTSLKADSLDMLGDSLVYAFSLLVLHQSAKRQASVSLLKGLVMVGFAASVMIDAMAKFGSTTVPEAATIGWIGLLALTMNTICFMLLWRHKSDNLNMSSTWLCSRNDLIANVGVLASAGLTALTLSKWPDLVVGIIIAIVFLKSSLHVLTSSVSELRTQ